MSKESEALQQNKMGYMPIPKLLFTMSLPMVASMLIQALYNIVDSMYVNMLSTQAFDALSIAFTIQNLMIGVATGTAVGTNALIARSLGAGDRDRANNFAMHGVLLAIFGYVLFLLFGIFGVGTFFGFYEGKVTPETLVYGEEYLTIICVFSFGSFLGVMFDRLMQSTGRTVYTLFTQGIGAVINIVLDPIMIFGYFGCPAMGVAGAAYATVISQIIGAFISMILNHKLNADLSMHPSKFKLDMRAVGKIYAIGVPSIIMVGIGSVMTFFMNHILGSITQTAITIFGAYFKIQSFIFMPVFGLNNGIIPILSYNYGAQNRGRMMQTVKIGLISAVVIMAIGFLIMQLFTAQILGIFETSTSPENLYIIGVPAFKIISICFVFAGFCIVLGSIFQALGRSIFSMFVSFARQLVILVPVAYLLSLSGDVQLVWWSFPIAEIASVVASALCFAIIYKKQIAPLPEHGGADVGDIPEPEIIL